jgi:hypothetical protein
MVIHAISSSWRPGALACLRKEKGRSSRDHALPEVSLEKTQRAFASALNGSEIRLHQRGNQRWGRIPSELLIPKAEPAATACDVALIFANGS